MNIALDLGFFKHRKLKRLVRLLVKECEQSTGLLHCVAAGCLTNMWTEAVTQCADGCFDGWTREDIADMCGWPGELCSGELFVGCLEEAGWLDVDGSETISIHNWWLRSPLEKERERKERERVKKQRQRALQSAEKAQLLSPDVPGTTGDVPGTVPDVPACPKNVPDVPPDLNRSDLNRSESIVDSRRPERVVVKKPKTKKATKAITHADEKRQVVDAYKRVSGATKVFAAAAYTCVDAILGEDGITTDDIIAAVEFGYRNPRVNDRGEREIALHQLLSKAQFPKYLAGAQEQRKQTPTGPRVLTHAELYGEPMPEKVEPEKRETWTDVFGANPYD